MTALKWTSCGQILSIVSKNRSTNCQTIHLFMSSNYQWYEKKSLVFTPNNPLLHFHWVTLGLEYQLKVVTKKHNIEYKFSPQITTNRASCCVINGKKLQITDFKDAVIPPMLFSKKIDNDRTINDAVFNHANNNQVAVIDSGNYLKIFDFDRSELLISVNLCDITSLSFPLAYYDFVWHKDVIIFLTQTPDGVVSYSVNPVDGNFRSETVDSVTHILCPYLSRDDVSKTKDYIDVLNTNDKLNFIDYSVKKLVKTINHKVYIFYLSSNCRFSINDKTVNSSVNSFFVFDAYLLLVTRLNELFCIRLTEEALEKILNDNWDCVYRRNIEQGANIITAIPNSPIVVLQMPRGNLETISCRLISIDILDRYLTDNQWEEAVRFIRFEKLNANLLFDLNPDRFLKNIEKFINGVKTINELNNICLEFENCNVLQTIYENCGKLNEAYPNKINVIFKSILNFFDSIDYLPFITTIMVIQITFFNIKGALIYLQDLLSRSRDDVSLKQIAIGAVNTLKTYGCHDNQLYTEALLLYDLELAHLIACSCQMDPRIYEPQLNTLKNMTEIQKRYEINVFAKNPKVAITYLLRSDVNDVTNFIRTNQVSLEAYKSVKKQSRFFETVSELFAETLSQKGCHYEAGVVLKRANLLTKALTEFKLGLRWREVLDLVEEIGNFTSVEKLNIINELAGRLLDKHLIREAAILYEFYGNNYELAVKVLIDNCLFEEGVHLARKYGRKDILSKF